MLVLTICTGTLLASFGLEKPAISLDHRVNGNMLDSQEGALHESVSVARWPGNTGECVPHSLLDFRTASK